MKAISRLGKVFAAFSALVLCLAAAVPAFAASGATQVDNRMAYVYIVFGVLAAVLIAWAAVAASKK